MSDEEKRDGTPWAIDDSPTDPTPFDHLVRERERLPTPLGAVPQRTMDEVTERLDDYAEVAIELDVKAMEQDYRTRVLGATLEAVVEEAQARGIEAPMSLAQAVLCRTLAKLGL